MTSTALLGLALPTTGTLSGTWGTKVNNSITQLIDDAIAGTTEITVDTDYSLTPVPETADDARQAILLCTGARTAIRTLTAYPQSKVYVIINSTTGGYDVKLVATGPTTGVSISPGEKALVAWDGSDFVKVANSSVTISGNYTLTITLSNNTSVTFPVSGTLATLAGAETLSNKRIDVRVSSTASASSLTPSIASYDQYNFTALATGLTINAPTGTPTDGDRLVFRILDNGSAQTLTWNSAFNPVGFSLPTTTTASKTTYVGTIYNASSSKWDVVAAITQA